MRSVTQLLLKRISNFAKNVQTCVHLVDAENKGLTYSLQRQCMDSLSTIQLLVPAASAVIDALAVQ